MRTTTRSRGLRVTVAGHVCVDLLAADLAPVEPGALATAGPLAVSLGGTCANAGRALSALGHRVDVACAVGDDPLGVLTAELLPEMVSGRCHLQRVTGSASYSLVLDEPGSDRSFRHHVGANAGFDPAAVPLAEADWLYVGYPSLVPSFLADDGADLVELLARARAIGARTLLDLAGAPADLIPRGHDWPSYFGRVLPWVDVFAPGWDDLADIALVPRRFDLGEARAVGRWALDCGAECALIGAGAQGSVLVDAHQGGRHRVAAPPGPIRRTNAAGDTFKSLFVDALGDGMPMADAQDAATDGIGRYLAGQEIGGAAPDPPARPGAAASASGRDRP